MVLLSAGCRPGAIGENAFTACTPWFCGGWAFFSLPDEDACRAGDGVACVDAALKYQDELGRHGPAYDLFARSRELLPARCEAGDADACVPVATRLAGLHDDPRGPCGAWDRHCTLESRMRGFADLPPPDPDPARAATLADAACSSGGRWAQDGCVLAAVIAAAGLRPGVSRMPAFKVLREAGVPEESLTRWRRDAGALLALFSPAVRARVASAGISEAERLLAAGDAGGAERALIEALRRGVDESDRARGATLAAALWARLVEAPFEAGRPLGAVLRARLLARTLDDTLLGRRDAALARAAEAFEADPAGGPEARAWWSAVRRFAAGLDAAPPERVEATRTARFTLAGAGCDPLRGSIARYLSGASVTFVEGDPGGGVPVLRLELACSFEEKLLEGDERWERTVVVRPEVPSTTTWHSEQVCVDARCSARTTRSWAVVTPGQPAVTRTESGVHHVKRRLRRASVTGTASVPERAMSSFRPGMPAHVALDGSRTDSDADYASGLGVSSWSNETFPQWLDRVAAGVAAGLQAAQLPFVVGVALLDRSSRGDFESLKLASAAFDGAGDDAARYDAAVRVVALRVKLGLWFPFDDEETAPIRPVLRWLAAHESLTEESLVHLLPAWRLPIGAMPGTPREPMEARPPSGWSAFDP